MIGKEENIKNKERMVIIMPIERLFHTGGFERTDEREMMDNIIGELYDNLNRKEGTPPYYVFIEPEISVPGKNGDIENRKTIKPDAIIVSEMGIIILEMKNLYGNITIKCVGRSNDDEGCERFGLFNEKDEKLFYKAPDQKNHHPIDPIKQLMVYRGKIWNLLEEYLDSKKIPRDSSFKPHIHSFIYGFFVYPSMLRINLGILQLRIGLGKIIIGLKFWGLMMW